MVPCVIIIKLLDFIEILQVEHICLIALPGGKKLFYFRSDREALNNLLQRRTDHLFQLNVSIIHLKSGPKTVAAGKS
jgi:hypothetical protein